MCSYFYKTVKVWGRIQLIFVVHAVKFVISLKIQNNVWSFHDQDVQENSAMKEWGYSLEKEQQNLHKARYNDDVISALIKHALWWSILQQFVSQFWTIFGFCVISVLNSGTWRNQREKISKNVKNFSAHSAKEIVFTRSEFGTSPNLYFPRYVWFRNVLLTCDFGGLFHQ